MKTFSLLVGFALSVLGAASHAQSADRPNIVFLLADDQCTYSMGCYGTPDVQTPNLDRLAEEGVVFDNHYDTTAICMASRASIFTGRLEYRTGCNFEHGHLLQALWQNSYPVLLRRAGYRTAFAGKFGLEVASQPDGPGALPEEDFDRWGGGPGQTFYQTAKNVSMIQYAQEHPHSTLAYGAFGRDFVRHAAKTERPFCLSISFKAPHRPDTPDPQFNHIYKGKTFTKPNNYGRPFGAHFSEQSRQGRQYARFQQWKYDRDYDAVMARYHQQIYGIDVAVGMIRHALKEQGVEDNTVILYTSDNGFFCGSHGYGSKVLPYEESSRVPLIILDPRHPNSGKRLRCRALTGNIDFAPTILDLAGVPQPEAMDGHSLLSLYDDPESTIHEWLPLTNVWGPVAVHSFAVVTRDWKYVFWPYGADPLVPTEELYQTAEDPLELTNLASAASHSADLDAMRAVYDQAVRRWKEEAVPYHRYQPFGVVFDRHVPWSEKQKLTRTRPPATAK